MKALKVGLRQFRTELARYIASETPVTITKRGRIVGHFIPTQRTRSERTRSDPDRQALKRAGEKLDELLIAHGADIESMVVEFEMARSTR